MFLDWKYQYCQRDYITQGNTQIQQNPYHIPSCGLLWWHSGWEFAYEGRGRGLEPCSGKTPHATEQLSPCTTTAEPVL